MTKFKVYICFDCQHDLCKLGTVIFTWLNSLLLEAGFCYGKEECTLQIVGPAVRTYSLTEIVPWRLVRLNITPDFP